MGEDVKDEFQEVVRVFVYGTLKPGEANYPRYCAGKIIDAKPAIALGKLLALPMGYPAMTAGDSPVQGYLLSFADADILGELDQLEGYDPTRPRAENEYNRQQIEIYDLQGRSLGWAWVYLMTLNQVEQLAGVARTDGWWSGSNCKF